MSPPPRPSLPSRSSRPPSDPIRPHGAQPTTSGFRRARPLVYALGVAGIAASGALIGAILKMNEQQKTQNAQQREEPQSGQESDQNDHVEYGKLIQTLETKRAHLLGQKIQLETKVRELHEAQRRKAQEEEVQDKLNLSREHSRFRVEK